MSVRKFQQLGDVRLQGNMRDGGILNLPDGSRVPVVRLDKGAFSTAFVQTRVTGLPFYLRPSTPKRNAHDDRGQSPLKNPTVFVFTRAGSGDYSKDILADICLNRRNKHLPCVQKVGWARGHSVYAMPFYRAPLRAGASAVAWKQAKQLQQCLDNVPYATSWNRDRFDGQAVREAVIACARAAKLAPALVQALRLLSDACLNYGDSWTFEFPPRNLATDARGNLILFDVIFDRDAIERVWEAKRKRAERRQPRRWW